MVDFGTDISSTPDLDPTFTLICGNRVVGEAITRRLTTPRGTLAFYPDYGIDIRLWLNESMDAATLAECAQAVETECKKDERINSIKSEVSFIYATGRLQISLAVTTSDGPFRLVLEVSKLSVEMLKN